MTLRKTSHAVAPHRRELEWPAVAAAPELAALAGLDVLLDLAITALVAAHPTLESGAPIDVDRAPPPLWLAGVIVDAAANLRVYLARYEVAIRNERFGDEQDLPW